MAKKNKFLRAFNQVILQVGNTQKKLLTTEKNTDIIAVKIGNKNPIQFKNLEKLQ